MNNYLVINNHRIELTEEQVNQIVAARNPGTPTIRLYEVEVGSTFKIGEHELIVLEQSGDTTAVIRKDLLPDAKFGDNSNSKCSKVFFMFCK